MKLSKQERIAAIVLIILVIVVAGVFLFIKPNIETIISTKETLSAKQKEYDDDVAKAGTKGELRDGIIAAYNNGKNVADRFFTELSAYEADNEFRAFLESCEANVLVEDLTVSAPGTAGLSSSMFVPTEVQYALKEFVNQGNTNEELDPGLVRQAAVMVILGEPQTIGATTVSFTLKATSLDDILKFADEVNNYAKNENGASVRKAIELNTITFTDNKAVDEYTALAESLKAQAEAKAGEVFKDKTGSDLSGFSSSGNGNTNTSTPANGDNNDNNNDDNNANTPGGNEQGEENLNHYYFEMPCTITFYSVERMQDPTPILDAQDKAADAA